MQCSVDQCIIVIAVQFSAVQCSIVVVVCCIFSYSAVLCIVLQCSAVHVSAVYCSYSTDLMTVAPHRDNKSPAVFLTREISLTLEY